jgi:hypothetical protein
MSKLLSATLATQRIVALVSDPAAAAAAAVLAAASMASYTGVASAYSCDRLTLWKRQVTLYVSCSIKTAEQTHAAARTQRLPAWH